MPSIFRSIAHKLTRNEVIEPRSYEAATVLFCQLVDFMFILTNTKPDQVVTFLNDVFTMFDQIIGRHDAYKVETTGETYMVASGVPNENENRHVFEISEIALEFREVLKRKFRGDWLNHQFFRHRILIGFLHYQIGNFKFELGIIVAPSRRESSDSRLPDFAYSETL